MLPIGLLLMFISGLFALSFEILLFRFYTVVAGSSPEVFGVVLGVFLIGIAFGARLSNPKRSVGVTEQRRRLAALFLAAAVYSYFFFALVAFLADRYQSYRYATIVLILPVPFISGLLFPLVTELSIPGNQRAGRGVAQLYFANIVGSTAGALLTGLWLLDLYSMPAAVGFVSLLALAGAVFAGLQGIRAGLLGVLGFTLLTVISYGLLPTIYGHFYEHLFANSTGERLVQVAESKSGVVMVDAKGAVVGDGVYDGQFEVVPRRGSNRIFRAYSIFCLNRPIGEVLTVGLGSGSWAQVMVNAPGVSRVTGIEINPAYVELIALQPSIRSLLTNSRFELHIADGRRWLKGHRERSFDLIVLNTAVPQRSSATNLLSIEFLRSVKQHLNPGGLVYMNWAYSYEVLRTVATAYDHAATIQNFVVASDEPFAADRQKCRRMYEGFSIDGRALFDPELDAEEIESLVAFPLMGTRKGLLESTSGFEIVTEDNMVTEFPGLWGYRGFRPVPDLPPHESLPEDP